MPTTAGIPELFAQNGGLLGLVLLALFCVNYAAFKVLANLVESHRTDLEKIAEIHRTERKEWWDAFDQRQKEATAAINALAESIRQQAARHRQADG